MTGRRSNNGNDTHPPWPTCGCGRSPIDDCVFWHELTQEEYEAKTEEDKQAIIDGD